MSLLVTLYSLEQLLYYLSQCLNMAMDKVDRGVGSNWGRIWGLCIEGGGGGGGVRGLDLLNDTLYKQCGKHKTQKSSSLLTTPTSILLEEY